VGTEGTGTFVPLYHAHIIWDWMDHDTGKSFTMFFAMSAYIYRIDEGLQFCIKAIQDFAYSGFGGRGGKHGDKAPLVSCQRCFGGLCLIAYLMLAHHLLTYLMLRIE